MYSVVNTPPPAQGAVSISTTPEHLQPPSVMTQTVIPMHTTHVQTQSQVVPPAASPSPSITSSTPGKVTGQSDNETAAVVIEQSPDKMSGQSKDEDCMYLKVKQADWNNPVIRQYLGYDKVIKMEPDVEPSTTDIKTSAPIGSSAVVSPAVKQEQQTVVMQPVVQPVPPILQPPPVYSATGILAGLQPMFPESEPEPNFITIGDK